MKRQIFQYSRLLLWLTGILAVFVIRTMFAASADLPRFADLFTVIILAGSLAVIIWGFRSLGRSDWIVAISLGAAVSVGMYFATLFTPYPFLGIFRGNIIQALIRGLGSTIAVLGGIVIMRLGGPVQFHITNHKWKKITGSFAFGLLVGAPLAILNVYALRLTQGQSFDWQNPLAAILDAWQPAIVEEVIYRFAFLGLIWLTLYKPLPDQAGWLAGFLALLVHNYSHFDDLFLQNPLLALGMGFVLAVIWGLPETILALRRGIESSIAFHWIQDAARFLAGY
jgi:hypothetical protein